MGKMRKYVEIFAQICGQGSEMKVAIAQIKDIPPKKAISMRYKK